jgi:hypothetical protein
MTSLSPSLYSVTLCPGDALILAGMLQAQPMTHVSHSQFNCAWDGGLGNRRERGAVGFFRSDSKFCLGPRSEMHYYLSRLRPDGIH